MDLTSERERPKKEVIRLGQDFQLFDPTIVKEEGDDIVGDIILETDILPNFRITIYAQNIEGFLPPKKYEAFTPFSPEDGYRITQEDLELERRARKLQRLMDEQGGQNVDLLKAPMKIGLDADWNVFKNINLTTSDVPWPAGYFEFKPEVADILRRLRIQMFCPSILVEARPIKKEFEKAALTFEFFYPVDTGPLASDEQSSETILRHDGLTILVPSDLNQLASIHARFILINDEQEERGSV